MVSTLYSTESTVVLVEYPPGDSSEFTLDFPEYQPRLSTSKLKSSFYNQHFKTVIVYVIYAFIMQT